MDSEGNIEPDDERYKYIALLAMAKTNGLVSKLLKTVDIDYDMDSIKVTKIKREEIKDKEDDKRG